MGEQRNLILAVAIAAAIMLLYQAFVLDPALRRQREAQAAAQAAAAKVVPAADPSGLSAPDPAPTLTRDQALARSARVPIRSAALAGSIALTGGLFDDLMLLRYKATVEPGSPDVTLLSPAAGKDAFYAFFGWTALGAASPRPIDNETVWTLVQPGELAPGKPILLAHDTPDGLRFRRKIEVDEDYLFTVTDEVTNGSGKPVTLSPYAIVRRDGMPKDMANAMILHEGPIGIVGEEPVMRRYTNLAKNGQKEWVDKRSQGGWLGITDKYWLVAAAPSPGASLRAEITARKRADATRFQSDYKVDGVEVPAGDAIRTVQHLFAGAKKSAILSRYERDVGIKKLDFAIDWGFLWFLTKPLFWILDTFERLVGNFGIALLMLTIVVRAAFLPIANASFKTMARMKALQPEMLKIRERFAADPQRQQQEIVALYQREKVNPISGCLPIIPQMFVFYALYKTLFVTIEMRHQPFLGFITDLSARDPTNIWNLFGLLPFDPAAVPLVGGLIGTGFLSIGILALLYGLTMGAMQTLNPPPPDPIQARVFALMPIIFTFVLATFASGLLIYWIWSNILSFAQQYVIMRRQGVDTPIGSFLAKRWRAWRGLPPPEPQTPPPPPPPPKAAGKPDSAKAARAPKPDGARPAEPAAPRTPKADAKAAAPAGANGARQAQARPEPKPAPASKSAVRPEPRSAPKPRASEPAASGASASANGVAKVGAWASDSLRAAGRTAFVQAFPELVGDLARGVGRLFGRRGREG